jgi:hypothetical protein
LNSRGDEIKIMREASDEEAEIKVKRNKYDVNIQRKDGKDKIKVRVFTGI